MRLIVFFLTAAFASGSLWGDVINYGSLFGTNASFLNISESSSSIGPGIGQVPELFGAPTISGDTLVFTPNMFSAQTGGPGVDFVNSQLSMTLAANPGFQIFGIMVETFGDYTILNPLPGGVGLAASSATLFATTPSGVSSGNSSFAELRNMPFGTLGAPWTESFVVNFDPTDNVGFTMDNSLGAIALTGTDFAFINQAGARITLLMTTAVPEPTSAILCLMTAGVMFWRRKR